MVGRLYLGGPFMSRASISASELRRRSLALILNPPVWPLWPFLTLRRVQPGGVIELGVLYDARGVRELYGLSTTVYLTNVFELPDTESAFLNLPRSTYDTLDELLDAGWVVD